MKKLLYYFVALFMFSACEEGEVGPQGPPGNANVISTEHIRLDVWYYDAGQKWYYSEIAMPEITEHIKNTGAVMVYQQLTSANGTRWIPLPDSFDNVTTNFDFYTGKITVYSFNIDKTTPIAPTGMVVRAVIIPASMRKAHPNTDWNNYQEVEALLNQAN